MLLRFDRLAAQALLLDLNLIIDLAHLGPHTLVGSIEPFQLRCQRAMPLFALTYLGIPRQRPLLKLLDPHQPPGDLIAILLARLAQLMNLRLYFAQRLAALLNLD